MHKRLRPVRAKVWANGWLLLLPLQGVDVYALIPRALPWAVNWLPFQGARGANITTFFATYPSPSLCEQSELQCWRHNRRLCGPAPCKVGCSKSRKISARFFAKQQVAKHAHMINEQSAKRSALKGQPVHSPGPQTGLFRTISINLIFPF